MNTEFRQDVALTPDFDYDSTENRTFRERLRQVAGDRHYEWWFSTSDCLAVQPTRVIVFADSEFELRRLQRDCLVALRTVADTLLGGESTLEFRVRDLGVSSPTGNVNRIELRNLNSTKTPSGLESGEKVGLELTRISGQLPMTTAGDLVNAPRNRGRLLSRADSEDRLAGGGQRLGSPDPQTETINNLMASRQRSSLSTIATANGVPPANAAARGSLTALSQFQYGQANELARVAIEQVLQTPGQYSPLMLVGPHGSGKTHLLEGMVDHFRRQSKTNRCVYMTAEQFTNSFVQALRGSGLPMFRRKYRDLQFLAIDDIQFFAGKKATINELQYTIDHLTRNGRQIVFAADRPPIELTEFGPELMTRCTAGLVCPVQYPDKQARYQILEQWCRQRGVIAQPEVLELLASQITRDARRLSGAINRLRAAMLTETNGHEVTVEMCRRVLQDMLVVNSHSTSLSRIDQVVCEMCGVDSVELKSENRGKKISTARMLAMWLSRRYTSSALSEIGDYFGGRSHSTVIAADKRVTDWINRRDKIQVVNTSYPVCDMVQRIESKLRIG